MGNGGKAVKKKRRRLVICEDFDGWAIKYRDGGWSTIVYERKASCERVLKDLSHSGIKGKAVRIKLVEVK